MKIHHFDGIYQERWGFFHVSGRVVDSFPHPILPMNLANNAIWKLCGSQHNFLSMIGQLLCTFIRILCQTLVYSSVLNAFFQLNIPSISEPPIPNHWKTQQIWQGKIWGPEPCSKLSRGIMGPPTSCSFSTVAIIHSHALSSSYSWNFPRERGVHISDFLRILWFAICINKQQNFRNCLLYATIDGEVMHILQTQCLSL